MGSGWARVGRKAQMVTACMIHILTPPPTFADIQSPPQFTQIANNILASTFHLHFRVNRALHKVLISDPLVKNAILLNGIESGFQVARYRIRLL